MIEVRRPDDNELCGHVESTVGGWRALTVFGATLGEHPTREDAERQVRGDGLASLAERWMLREGRSRDGEIVCIQEANPDGVTVALGYYALPGVPTRRISRRQLDEGEWVFER